MAAETDVRNCKVGKLVFYFSNDGAKTCSAQKVLAIHFFFFLIPKWQQKQMFVIVREGN